MKNIIEEEIQCGIQSEEWHSAEIIASIFRRRKILPTSSPLKLPQYVNAPLTNTCVNGPFYNGVFIALKSDK